MSTKPKLSIERLPFVSLAIALLLSALGTPVLKALVQKGGHFGTAYENAISYCNVLFVGNLCSAAVVFLYFWPPRVVEKAKRITRESWKSLLANTLLGNVIAPMLVISALEDGGNIVTVILLLQTSAVFFTFFSWLMFGETVTWRCVFGLGFIVIGLVALVALPGTESLGSTHYYTVAAAMCRALGSCTARKTLEDSEIMPVFLVFRNLLGAIGFFILAIQMFGMGHFQDALQPELWPLMLVYGAVIVVLGQLTWFQAVSRLPTETISTWGTVTPGLAMAFAYMLLGEIPSSVQWLSLLVVVAGLLIAKSRPRQQELSQSTSASISDLPLTGR